MRIAPFWSCWTFWHRWHPTQGSPPIRQHYTKWAWPQGDDLRDLEPGTSSTDAAREIEMDILGCAAAFQN